MKKLIFCFVCTLCCSCSVTTTTTTSIGDVTTYTQNGEVLRKWEQVVLQLDINTNFAGSYSTNAFKTFGLNFYDKKSGKHIIIGNGVPYIIEYTTEQTYKNTDYNYSKNEITKNEQPRNEDYKLELINQWKELDKQAEALKADIKKSDKGSVEHQNLKDRLSDVTKQMLKISNTLWIEFNYPVETIRF